MCVQLNNLDLFHFVEKKEKRDLFITTNNLHNSMFPSFNLFMFTNEDCTNINNDDRKYF